jgi:3-dehydroquinate synthase
LRSGVHLRRIEQSFDIRFSYPVIFTRGALAPENPALGDVLASAGARRHRILTALDGGLLEADPGLVERLRTYAACHGDRMELVAPPLVVRGGEICKSEPLEVEALHSLVERHHICRHSFVLAIGGGSVLDAAGFAASTAHRGVRLIRMPSTALAQNDAGIGVKNAVNHHHRKNFIGTFAPPFAVVNDLDFLATLQDRDLRAGIAEALKVALIRDQDFFDFLQRHRQELARFEPDTMEQVVVRCAELHLHHIRTSGDPLELGSARPLDFGHWSAHKLEEISGNELRHGEAVAIGIAIDALYSQQTGRIGERELLAILSTLEGIGYDLHHRALLNLDVEKALSEFREHLGGELSITLLEGIGRGVEVSEIDRSVMNKCVGLLAEIARNGLGKPTG